MAKKKLRYTRVRNKQPEHELQKTVATFLDLMILQGGESPLYSATVGGVRTTMRQAIKMKQTGYKKGIPDIIIFESRNGYHGLAIELKTKKGYASKHQKEWIEKLLKRGYYACVCKGLDDAIYTIKTYFSIPTTSVK
tara:strand:- start:211 stop:621 length:411 start_codon:yes stop_codon:yes gene_type:complete